MLITKIDLQESDELFLLGDYINRGPDSKGVLDLILALQERGYKVTLLRGNHEQMFLDALSNSKLQRLFLRYGGYATLKSFGVHSLKKIPSLYIDLIHSTQYFHQEEPYIMVHAGIDYLGNEIDFENTDAMMWARKIDIPSSVLKGSIIIHGHTPAPKSKIIKQLKWGMPGVINIDSGCVYHLRKGSRLCAFDIDAVRFYWSKNIDAI